MKKRHLLMVSVHPLQSYWKFAHDGYDRTIGRTNPEWTFFHPYILSTRVFWFLTGFSNGKIQLLKWSSFQIHSTTKAKIDTGYHRKHRECNILLCARFSPKHLVEATASEITCITRREKSMPFDFRLKHRESKVNILVLWHTVSS